MRFPLPVALVPLVLAPCPGDEDPGPAAPLDRPADGVVVTGAELESLLGTDPASLVAYRWTAEAGFAQVPVQVDERAVVSWLQIYGGKVPKGAPQLDPELEVLTWCDPTTHVGADHNTFLDENDEVALAAADAGERAPLDAALPAGVLATAGAELRLVDPLSGGVGWLYLFQQDGSLDPSAGEDRVQYDFELASAFSYLEGYQLFGGTNPEVSSVTAPGYWSTGFADRWLRHGLRVEAGGATGVELLDRARTGSDPPECIRNEDTFCCYTAAECEGAFLANIDGPVRAIRSLVGANSGILTQRDHVFWQRREDMRTHIRLHPIDYAMQDSMNLALPVLGMRYYASSLEGAEIVMDGVPEGDPKPKGTPAWEMLTGPQGTVISSQIPFINAPGTKSVAAFSNDLGPTPLPCTGGLYALEVFGWRVEPEIGNTDPRLEEIYGVVYTVRNDQVFFFEAPDQELKLAELRHKQHKNPLKVHVLPFGSAAASAAPPPPPPQALTAATQADGPLLLALELPGAVGARWRALPPGLPQGLVLDAAGVLRGKLTATGTHRLVLAVDHAGGTSELELSLSVPETPEAELPWYARIPGLGPWLARILSGQGLAAGEIVE
jgi:hypothetical protein